MAWDWGGIIGSVIDFGSDYLQQEEQNKAQEKVQEIAQQAAQGIRDFEAPTVDQLTAKLQEYVYAGDYTPYQAVAILQEQSKLQGFNISPEVLASQYQTLNKLAEIGKGGYTPEMQAGIQRAITQSDTASRGARQALSDQYEQRGLGGSGNELLQKQLAQQNAANVASQQGLDIAANSQKLALQALADSGNMASKMRGQETEEQDKVAAAQDVINRFNAQNKQDVANANIDIANKYGAANLANRQDLYNTNTGVANTNAANRAKAQQSVFDNALNKSRALVNANAPIMAATRDQSASNIETIGQYGNALKNVGQTVYSGYKSDQEKKDKDYADYVKTTPEYNQTYARGGQVPAASAPALQYNGGGMVTKTAPISKKEAIKLLDEMIPRRKFL